MTMRDRWMPRRRSLLTAGAAAVALAGCGSVPPARAAGRVVVVGGGFGGATAAHYLKRWAPDAEVTLVDRQPRFISCPMSNLVLTGHLTLAEISRGYDGLQALGVHVLQGEAMAIDVAAREVRLADGRRLAYDRLVVSPGIDFMSESVPGLDAALDSGRVTHAWKAGAQTLALRRQLESLSDGGLVVISVPAVPFRCPPGPYERACLIAAYLKVAKPRAKLIVCDANPDIASKKALFSQAFAEHYAGRLEYRPNAALRELQPDGTARFEFEDLKPEVLNVIPPMRAGDIARQAGLVTAGGRWCGVDWLTGESLAAPYVHVLGDATLSAPGMPKSGHMANQQAKVAAAAIAQLLKGQPVNVAPVVMNTCYSFVTPELAGHVASVHQYDAARRSYQPVAGAGGVSPAASALEARYARSWARNIWSDTLAGAGV
jgi:sulfide dehydrogenase [flavocytochrome c] flavoprotein subunit